jgi:hypothetical protein
MLRAVADESPDASVRFQEVFGDGDGWVWKDPRLTVLLPFWDAVLGVQPVLFVHRSPEAVAASIRKRDGLSTAQAMALWERHTRLALASLAGRRVLVEGYGALCASPDEWLRRLVAFCSGAGLDVHEPSPSVDVGVRPSSEDGAGARTAAQQALVARLEALDGPHHVLPETEIEPETLETRELLDSIAPPVWLAPQGQVEEDGAPAGG